MKKRKRGMSGCGETLSRPVRHREPLMNSSHLRELSEVSQVLLPRVGFPPHPVLNGNHVVCKPNSTDGVEIRPRGIAGRQRAVRFADGRFGKRVETISASSTIGLSTTCIVRFCAIPQVNYEDDHRRPHHLICDHRCVHPFFSSPVGAARFSPIKTSSSHSPYIDSAST